MIKTEDSRALSRSEIDNILRLHVIKAQILKYCFFLVIV